MRPNFTDTVRDRIWSYYCLQQYAVLIMLYRQTARYERELYMNYIFPVPPLSALSVLLKGRRQGFNYGAESCPTMWGWYTQYYVTYSLVDEDKCGNIHAI